MQPAEASSSFFRVDEVNEAAGQDGPPNSPQTNVPQDPWVEGADGIRHPQVPTNPPTDDPADTGQPAASRSPGRPALRKDQWAPIPQNQQSVPQSDTAAEDADVTTDSLSMAQLRRIVQEIPKKEATHYAFEYSDTSSFEEEIEELFEYSREERNCLDLMSLTYESLWLEWQLAPERANATKECVSWTNASSVLKEAFLEKLKSDLLSQVQTSSYHAIAVVAYLTLGCWKETANQQKEQPPAQKDSSQNTSVDPSSHISSVQVAEMKANIVLIAENIGIGPIFTTLKSACVNLFPDGASVSNVSPESSSVPQQMYMLRCCVVVSYLLVDHARRVVLQDLHLPLAKQYEEACPEMLNYLTRLLAHLRWNEHDSHGLPLLKILSLLWKTMLLTFGGTKDADDVRRSFDEKAERSSKNDGTSPLITTSPLDYHLFRQEITSKYPAFDPPQPLFPFEADTTSMIPPLQNLARSDSQAENSGPANVHGGGSSILHQPVHIATPAPSPPPSPAGPSGKGIKKQNYQTNQLFPFLYPPLDDTSNSIGGKGRTELQDLLVGRKWEGRDIPTSILEAADIFASRMRASRAMKQLWDERVRFIKYERGYLSFDDGHVDQSSDSPKERPLTEAASGANQDPMFGRLDKVSQQRLAAVDEFYRSQLPRLQSVVIVLLKVLLQTVTTLVTQPNAPNGLQTGFESPEQNPQDRPQANGGGAKPFVDEDNAGVDNINTIRNQEIMSKAVSGMLLLLLKWFKLSHILKFEYLTQLLLDSNYVQLILKLFTHQELERAVNVKYEKQSLNFFTWCCRSASSSSSSPHPNSATVATAAQTAQDNEDSAVPPPIPRTSDRMQSTDPLTADISGENLEAPLTAVPPEVDELGYSTSSPSSQPITTYSWRTFFTSINFLRILQKVVKSKPHRQLLMVQYKYSNILKKSLKVPQPDVRLYTLKIIKGQVPYCHRKWRQSNMRIITAIYLHCKPELRDDWLAGLTMEEEMGEALPQEQALRSLTYWFNLSRYPEGMAGREGAEKARGLLDEEQDFFVKELGRMEGVGATENGNADSAGLITGNGRGEGEVDPLDTTADAAGWSQEEREAFLQRTREIMEVEERAGLTRW